MPDPDEMEQAAATVTCLRCVRGSRFEAADVVAPVAYAGHNGQSGKLLYEYKQPLAARDDRRATVQLMLLVATRLHLGCLESTVGSPVGAWTTRARLQSMALPLRAAGAAAVSGLVLAR